MAVASRPVVMAEVNSVLTIHRACQQSGFALKLNSGLVGLMTDLQRDLSDHLQIHFKAFELIRALFHSIL